MAEANDRYMPADLGLRQKLPRDNLPSKFRLTVATVGEVAED